MFPRNLTRSSVRTQRAIVSGCGRILTRTTSSSQTFVEQERVLLLGSKKAEALSALERNGFHIITDFLGRSEVKQMRAEAERLYEENHMFQSYSIMENGERHYKPNVYAYELDGHEWNIAPKLLAYTRDVLLQIPPILNESFPQLRMSQRSYGTKLAVSLGDGSKYPKHCDNAGMPDQRKLTLVYYLNDEWKEKDGGYLRIFTKEGKIEQIAPKADTLAMFWSDQIVHDVTPSPDTAKSARRYALTLWLVSENPNEIVNPKDPLFPTRCKHFPLE